MKYINDCLNFIDLELGAVKKEMGRLLSLTPSQRLAEGQMISQVKVKSFNEQEGSTTFSFAPQFTKVREEKKVIFYFTENKERVKESEIIEVDLLKHEFTCYGQFDKTEYFVIQSLDVPPYLIIDALKVLQEDPSLLIQNLINRKSQIMAEPELSVENMIKTVDSMNNAFMINQGIAGAGKSYYGSKVINHLLKKGKRILMTSNSHSAINNLLEKISHSKFEGAKICSRSQQQTSSKLIQNIRVSGKEVDSQVAGYQLLAGTCFAISRIKNVQFDYLIVDEASQLKMSFLLVAARLAKNVIVLGDQQQLQSISQIPSGSGGESVLDYLLQGKKVVPRNMGYFLNKTYRCSPSIAKPVSEVFYEGKAGWAQEKDKDGITLITTSHNSSQKISPEEGEAVQKIYKSLIKNKKANAEDIMVITPYNAQVSYLRSLISNTKTRIGTVDGFQGLEAKYVIISFCDCGKKQVGAEFVTNPNRLNVAISRAMDGVFLVSSEHLVKSKFVSPEFKKLLNYVNQSEPKTEKKVSKRAA